VFLVGFIIRIYHDARSHERKKNNNNESENHDKPQYPSREWNRQTAGQVAGLPPARWVHGPGYQHWYQTLEWWQTTAPTVLTPILKLYTCFIRAKFIFRNQYFNIWIRNFRTLRNSKFITILTSQDPVLRRTNPIHKFPLYKFITTSFMGYNIFLYLLMNLL